MVTCESYMFECNVSNDMKKKLTMKGGGSRAGSGTFTSNTNR